MESNATVYEVVNKVTGEISPVTQGEAGNETVTWHLADGTPIVFSNVGGVGDLQNDNYAIREVESHTQADGTGTVEVETTPEGTVEVVTEDAAPETAGDAETTPDVVA